MNTHFSTRAATRKILTSLNSRHIRQSVERIQQQADGDGFSQELQGKGKNLKAYAQPIDLTTAVYRWFGLSALCAALIGGAVAYLVYNPQIEGAALYALLSIAALIAACLPFTAGRAYRAWNSASHFDSSIESAAVTEAHLFVKTFGHVRERGRAIVNIAAGAEAVLSAWIVLAATSGLALAIKGALAAAVAIIVVGIVSILSAMVERAWGQKQARERVRLKENSVQKTVQHAQEVEFLRTHLSARYGNNFRAPRAVDTLKLLLPIVGILLVFCGLFAIRLYVPTTDASFSTETLMVISALCCFMAIISAIYSAGGHLLPEAGRVYSAISHRFPSVNSFNEWRSTTDAEIERLLNRIAREATLLCLEEDATTVKHHVKIPMPFPTAPIAAPTSATHTAAMPASGFSAAPPAPYTVKWVGSATAVTN